MKLKINKDQKAQENNRRRVEQVDLNQDLLVMDDVSATNQQTLARMFAPRLSCK